MILISLVAALILIRPKSGFMLKLSEVKNIKITSSAFRNKDADYGKVIGLCNKIDAKQPI